ncbi:MAG: hypothetical protein R2788_09965 [Saprospiraceae bacterium]
MIEIPLVRDAYKSIFEAFIHAGAVNECKVEVISIQCGSTGRYGENVNEG